MPSTINISNGFNKEEFKGLAVDAYLVSKCSVKRFIAEKEFVYGYKKERQDGSLSDKFATLMILRSHPALILHIGKKPEKKGLELQMEVDKKLGKSYERNEVQINEKPHETFIRLDWVNELEDIKEFIDEVFEKRS
ncbi:hypothetical protein [Peribacillus asahii]|uniref:hypothetical protein n=1 Tax=Peribacillus asahii TaxID=228899 RepID=UPI00380B7800